jgi:AraC family transcriptional regulator
VNNYERVQRSIDFMEEHLKEPVGLEDIAQAACFSLPHFYRLFNALVGRTIKDYLRMRRLSEAAAEVAAGDRSVLDIALDYQFGSQESFSRAFRETWGVNPGGAKRSGRLPGSFPRIDLLEQHLEHRAAEAGLAEGGGAELHDGRARAGERVGDDLVVQRADGVSGADAGGVGRGRQCVVL